MTCKTCKYLALPLNKNGKRYAAPNHTYRCLAIVPNDWWITLPHSVVNAYGFRRDLHKTHMSATDGEGCPSYEEHKP